MEAHFLMERLLNVFLLLFVLQTIHRRICIFARSGDHQYFPDCCPISVLFVPDLAFLVPLILMTVNCYGAATPLPPAPCKIRLRYVMLNRNTLILNILIFNFMAVHVCVV